MRAELARSRKAPRIPAESFKFPRGASMTVVTVNREAAQGLDRVTRFQGENAI
ncbi:MAG: hypothetical protein ACRDJX_00110 [Solirubrobacteraceae bacterium]